MPTMNARNRGGSLYDESIYGHTTFGAPITKKTNVFTLDIPVNPGLAALGKDAADYYNDGKRYIGRYDMMIINIASIRSVAAQEELGKQIGSAKEAGTRILGWLISSGSPAYYATEVRGYVMDAEKPPYSVANPNYLAFTKRRAIKRVEGLGSALKALEPKVEEAMKVHGVLPPDQTAEFEARLKALQAQIAKLQAKEGAEGGAPVAPGAPGSPQAVTELPKWVIPVVIGGGAIILLGAFFFLSRKQ